MAFWRGALAKNYLINFLLSYKAEKQGILGGCFQKIFLIKIISSLYGEKNRALLTHFWAKK